MAKRDSPYNGLLIVDKPGHPSSYLPTSHDIVASVRRWSGQRRIGHTGTLDPMASGVLVLCMGRATRLVEYYQGHDKQYLADVTLGSATDTYDAMGSVTETASVPEIDIADLEHALGRFRGDITQTPPVYSAIKQQGEALHRKARRGEAVVVPSRQVTIHQLGLLEFMPDARIRLRIVCSAGAYIRSLAHDLGIALGTYAHLTGLRREAAGPFTLTDARTLDEIKLKAESDELQSILLPMGSGLDMPAILVDAETMTSLGHGQQVALPSVSWHHGAAELASLCEREGDVLAQAVGPEGSLAGIIKCIGPTGSQDDDFLWRAAKWFRTT